MQEYRAYIMGLDGHVQSRVDLSELNNLLMVTTSNYGNWIGRFGRSSTREMASHLSFAGLDFRLGLKPELQVTACGATVLFPEFPSAGFDLFISPMRGRTFL